MTRDEGKGKKIKKEKLFILKITKRMQYLLVNGKRVANANGNVLDKRGLKYYKFPLNIKCFAIGGIGMDKVSDQGKGYGTVFVKLLEKHVRSLGCRYMSFHNVSAGTFFTKFGYAGEGVTARTYIKNLVTGKPPIFIKAYSKRYGHASVTSAKARRLRTTGTKRARKIAKTPITEKSREEYYKEIDRKMTNIEKRKAKMTFKSKDVIQINENQ